MTKYDTLLEVIEGPQYHYEITDKPYSERHPEQKGEEL